MHTTVADRTLFSTLAARSDVRLVPAAAVVLMTGLTIAAAQVSVPLPFTPVPFSVAPMVVLLGGAVLGSRLGAASQVLYLALGIAGLPVFAAAALPQGPLRLLGPTGGYLMAYPAAAFLAGWLAERGFDRRYWTSFVAMAAGLGVIFAGGVIWLSFVSGLPVALRLAFWPFVAADLLKVAIAAAVLPAMWRLVPAASRR
jgi:biotin transport system substrate-specific component